MSEVVVNEILKTLSAAVYPAVVAGGAILDFQSGLFCEEEMLVSNAVRKRRLEFTAGRTAARMALRSVNGPDCAIPSGKHREPLWPEGWTGSITHTDEVCLAACARVGLVHAVGIDAELLGRMHRDLWRAIFSDAECEQLALISAPGFAATAGFCAKEAFFKAQYAVSGRLTEMREMCLSFLDGGKRLEIRHDIPELHRCGVPELVSFHVGCVGEHVVVGCVW